MPLPVRTLSPQASGFNPASISGIVHWWDANDDSTLTFVSGQVSEWRSKVGAKTAATQTTANNRPVTTTVNRRTAILFDGSNDGFNFTGTSRTDETWIVATAQTADQAGTRTLVNDGGDGHGFNHARAAAGRIIDTSWGNSTEGTGRLRPLWSANAADPFGPAVTSVVRSTAAGGFVFINGTQRSSIINGDPSFTTSGAVTIQRIGYYSSTLFQLQGWIGEILCWNRALSAAERLRVERWLGRRWGITVA